MKDAVLSAMGSRDEVSLDEVCAALFCAYTEVELMRAGTIASGRRTSLMSDYMEGRPMDADGRSKLAWKGVKKLMYDMKKNGFRWISVDLERRVARRVRT